MTIIEYNNNFEDNDNLLDNNNGYYLFFGFKDTIVYSVHIEEEEDNNSSDGIELSKSIFPTSSPNEFSMIGIHKTLNFNELNNNNDSSRSLNDHSLISNKLKNELIEILKKQIHSSSTTRSYYTISFQIIRDNDETIEKSPILFFQILSKQLLDNDPIEIKQTKKIENSLLIQELMKSFYLVNIKTRKETSYKTLLDMNNNNNIIHYNCIIDSSSSTTTTTPIILSNNNNKYLDKKISEIIKDQSKNNNNNIFLPISATFEIFFKITSSSSNSNSLVAPLISLKLNDNENKDKDDSMVMISSICLISKNDSVKDCLNLFKQSITEQVNNFNKIQNFKVLHYQLPFLPFPISVIFEKSIVDGIEKQVNDDSSYEIRKKYHNVIGLPNNRPFLKSNLSIDLSNYSSTSSSSSLASNNKSNKSITATTTQHIKDIHMNLSLSSNTDGNVYLVQGSYDYYHYLQDNIDDNGWGCAYRSMQTICSWLRYQGLTNKPVPTHYEIQKTLVEMQDKEPSFLKSKQWIGAFEITLCLNQLYNIESKILNITTGSDIIYKSREIAAHFQRNESPIMIGGGVLAYTLLGIDFNESTGNVRYLILDPHYTGATDNIKLIKDKGWCGWKGPDLFRKDAFYNLCMPQVPNDL